MSLELIADTLQQQLKLYHSLLEIELSKKGMIIQNHVLQLNVQTQKQKLLVAKAEELERMRTQLTSRYFKDIGFRIRSGILAELIRSVTNPEIKVQLLQLHSQLNDVLGKLKEANDLNQQLIKQSLDFLDFSIGLMMDDPNEDLTYQHPMNQGYGNKFNKLFDSKA
ncbi:flagellar protein FlgN [Paenibacillus algorifonticola]|uniref:flagellar protein FlgN n=1 Tax=Paenibacillus algorifonticola TaxID=684063 RepID=UPI003D2C45A7